MKLQQSFAFLVRLAAIAGHAEASSAPASSSSVHTASPPAAAATQSASQNAAQAEGAVEDAQTKARASAWFAYRRSVIDALSASPDPRDWHWQHCCRITTATERTCIRTRVPCSTAR